MSFERFLLSKFDSNMPLSEFYRSANGKNDIPQQKPSDVSYIPNNEYVELVWEKGQIMMQGQSSKARKTPVSSNFQFHTPKIQEKESILDVPLVEMGMNQDDDMVPWLNYPLDDYCSDLLPEISGVTVNESTMRNSLNVIDKSSKDSHSLTQNVSLHRDINLDQSKVSRNSNLFSWSSVLVPAPYPSVARPGASELGGSNRRSKPQKVGSSGSLEKTAQKQDSLLPYSTSTLLNFSHFSRPAAMAKATLQNNEHLAAVNVMNHGPQKEMGLVSQPSLDSGKVGQNPTVCKSIEEHCCVEKACDDRREEDATAGNDKSTNVVADVSASKAGLETEKSNEHVGATSSVCSGNGGERASNDLTKNSKRKSHDTEDFECQSQDVEEESLGTKTASTSRGTGSKRSRAAEVHNLSERRRRDRINEKMRSLQELIPNCNKVDKASMLDEAIEYLKTLQLQVQIMSLGSGLCMQPMMFPPGMHPAHVPHLSPMGMGMGMSYGMGMGMADMTGGPQGHPQMFPFPPNTQASRPPTPSQPISGLDCCPGVPRSPFQVYGHPGQGMPMLYPQQPMPGFPMNPGVGHMRTQAEAPDVASVSTEPMQHKNPSQVEKRDQDEETGCSTAGTRVSLL